MIIKFTKHADFKRKLSGIEVEQIKRCIQRGSKIRQTDGYLASYTYIKVAYKKRGNIYKIKTVYVGI